MSFFPLDKRKQRDYVFISPRGRWERRQCAIAWAGLGGRRASISRTRQLGGGGAGERGDTGNWKGLVSQDGNGWTTGPVYLLHGTLSTLTNG